MSGYTAPFVQKKLTLKKGVTCLFSRKGFTVELPSGIEHPWFTLEYRDALVSSGLRPVRVHEILTGIAGSLANSILLWRRGLVREPLSAPYKTSLLQVADDLAQKFGWASTSSIHSGNAQQVMQYAAHGTSARNVLRRLLVSSGHLSPALPRVGSACELENRMWAEEDLKAFAASQAHGSLARVAVFLMLHLGMPMAELMLLKPSQFREGLFHPPAGRTARRLHPEVLAELSGIGHGEVPYLRGQTKAEPTAVYLERLVRAAAARAGVPAATVRTLRNLRAIRTAEVIAPC